MRLTFGLNSPGKGIEHDIEALPATLKRHPDPVSMVVGATHPDPVKAEGVTYRLSLERRFRALGVESNLIFQNRGGGRSAAQ